MVTADQARAELRQPLVEIVEAMRARGHSKMDAYRSAARAVGRSPAWVQRIVGRDPRATAGLHDWLNIRATYDRLCARIEANTAEIQAERAGILGKMNATAEGPAGEHLGADLAAPGSRVEVTR